MTKKVVIDADQMVYACGFAAEGEPLSHSLHLVNKAINQTIQDTGAEVWDIYIGGKGNFREDIATSQGYKATRSGRKPEHYNEIRKHLKESWDAKESNGMEADDKCSIIQWEAYKESDRDSNIVISSPDKDLLNTPGYLYNPRTREVKWITEEQADRHFLYQVLAGDRVDNIRGLPRVSRKTYEEFGLSKAALKGCGERTAKKLMATTKTPYEAERLVYKCYAEWGLEEIMSEDQTKEYLTEQAQLLWMVRELDEFEQPILWTPDNTLFKEVWDECASAEEAVYSSDGSSEASVDSGV